MLRSISGSVVPDILKALRQFDTPEIIYPKAQPIVSEDLNLQQNCRENHKSRFLRALVLEFLDVTEVLFPNSFICMNVDSCNLNFVPSLKFWLLYTVSDNLVHSACALCPCCPGAEWPQRSHDGGVFLHAFVQTSGFQ